MMLWKPATGCYVRGTVSWLFLNYQKGEVCMKLVEEGLIQL